MTFGSMLLSGELWLYHFLGMIDKTAVIGKVIENSQDKILIEYWKGSWNKKWYRWKEMGLLWTDELSKDCIYLTAFELQDSKLHPETKRQMRDFMP